MVSRNIGIVNERTIWSHEGKKTGGICLTFSGTGERKRRRIGKSSSNQKGVLVKFALQTFLTIHFSLVF